jgi:nucleotide-binding universal stress UspA family protein
MYQRILLAYDGSIEGARALREGALLARTCSAQVFLLSVIPRKVSLLAAEGVHGSVVAQQIDSYKQLFVRAVDRLRQLGFEPLSRLVSGEPAPMIGAVAREFSADLVVVGHHTQNFLSRWWSGSNQAYLKDHVDCSLLIACNSLSEETFEAQMSLTAGADS